MKNRSDVNAQWGRYNPVTKDFELASLSSYLSSADEGVLSQQTVSGNAMGLSKLHSVRKVVTLLGILNWGIALVSAYVVVTAARAKCPQKVLVASSIVGVGAGIRVLWMVGMAYAQAVTASAMIAEERDPSSQPAADGGTLSRAERRVILKNSSYGFGWEEITISVQTRHYLLKPLYNGGFQV